ncbi:MAG TPA: hypothetical protein VGD56_21045 [Gemmatirosa sp.]
MALRPRCVQPRWPYHAWTRFFGDWVLAERTEAAVVSLVSDAVGDAVSCHLSRDATGLAILAELQRRPAPGAV